MLILDLPLLHHDFGSCETPAAHDRRRRQEQLAMRSELPNHDTSLGDMIRGQFARRFVLPNKYGDARE